MNFASIRLEDIPIYIPVNKNRRNNYRNEKSSCLSVVLNTCPIIHKLRLITMLPSIAPTNTQVSTVTSDLEEGFAMLNYLCTAPRVLDKETTTRSPETPKSSNPATPLVMSPGNSASTPSSPCVGSSVWDIPETPLRDISNQDSFGLSTPLTPPATLDSLNHTYEPQNKSAFLANAHRVLSESGREDCRIAPTTPIRDVTSSLDSLHGCEKHVLESKKHKQGVLSIADARSSRC